MKTFFAVFVVLLSGVYFNCQAEEAKPNEKPLADVKKEIQEGKAVIVDVREQTEWDAGHVKDAKLVPLSALKAGKSDLSALPKDKIIYTYCVRGVRAATAAGILKEKGYQATSLKRGLRRFDERSFLRRRSEAGFAPPYIKRLIVNASIQACLILACVHVACAFAGDAVPGDESPGFVTTLGGTAIECLIVHPSPWTLASASGNQTLKFDEIASVVVGERLDPNVENEALVSVGELQNENFETREKAETKLRGLGRVAARPLRQALTSPDKEVSRRARALLIEMGALEDEGLTQDRVTLRDGSVLKGELSLTDLPVRSRFGRLRFPIESVERIVFHATAPAAPPGAGPFAAADAKEIVVPIPIAGPVEAAAAQRWDPYEEARADPTVLDGWLAEAQRNALTMDKIADPKAGCLARRARWCRRKPATALRTPMPNAARCCARRSRGRPSKCRTSSWPVSAAASVRRRRIRIWKCVSCCPRTARQTPNRIPPACFTWPRL